jgi:hypothetical protein
MTVSMTLAETAYASRSLTQSLTDGVKSPSRSRVMAVLVAGTTALAMIAASAAPAHADRRGNNALKALAAIAAIALIANAVKDNKRHQEAPTPVQAPRVPGVCAIEIGSGQGAVTGFAERCLREEGFSYQLPNGCSTDIRIYGRTDKFYPEQCLRDAGFTTRDY